MLDVIDNIYIFKGSVNPLTSSRTYNREMLCDYQLQYYPFDTQKCQMVLTIRKKQAYFLKLQRGIYNSFYQVSHVRPKGTLDYVGPVNLAVYFIKDISFTEVFHTCLLQINQL